MAPLKAFLLLCVVAATLLIGVSTFNYHVDPMCFYQCENIDLNKSTMNTYYHIGQKIMVHPDAELIMLGSSRGQTTPPMWVQKRTGLKTLNLSMGGAEISAKTAFLELALEKLKVKKVIWFADYFELTSEIEDSKIKNTPALRKYLSANSQAENISTFKNKVLSLIDHNTLEASFYALKNASKIQLDQGSGSFLDIDKCESESFKGEKSRQDMEKEKGFTYDSYTHKVLKPGQSEKAWQQFFAEMQKLSQRNIDVLILITPYNPEFLSRMKSEYPEMNSRHLKWIQRLVTLNIPNIKVVNDFGGIPGGNDSEKYWNDGVHFTCKGSIEMLKPNL
jgi:hypothetical protein